MLFRPRDLEGIAAGTITLAFRRWDKPRVNVGSQQKTAVGVVEFTSCDVVETVTEDDARAAGFDSPEAVEARMRKTGRVYRVGLRLAGPDPRVALRSTPPDDAVFAAVAKWDWRCRISRRSATARACGRPTWPSRSDGRRRRSSAMSVG